MVLEGAPVTLHYSRVSLFGLQINHVMYQDTSEMALYRLRLGYSKFL